MIDISHASSRCLPKKAGAECLAAEHGLFGSGCMHHVRQQMHTRKGRCRMSDCCAWACTALDWSGCRSTPGCLCSCICSMAFRNWAISVCICSHSACTSGIVGSTKTFGLSVLFGYAMDFVNLQLTLLKPLKNQSISPQNFQVLNISTVTPGARRCSIYAVTLCLVLRRAIY